MSRKFQIKRGLLAKIPTLAQAEFGMTTNSGTEQLFIGTGSKNLEIPFLRDLTPEKLGAVSVALQGGYKLKVERGDQSYIKSSIDASVPNIPATSNYTHYITLDATNRVMSALSVPLDYTDRAYYYAKSSGKWLELATLDSVTGDLETRGNVKAQGFRLNTAGRTYTTMGVEDSTKELWIMLDDPTNGVYCNLIMGPDKLMYMDKNEYAKEILHEGNISRLLGAKSATVE